MFSHNQKFSTRPQLCLIAALHRPLLKYQNQLRDRLYDSNTNVCLKFTRFTRLTRFTRYTRTTRFTRIIRFTKITRISKHTKKNLFVFYVKVANDQYFKKCPPSTKLKQSHFVNIFITKLKHYIKLIKIKNGNMSS